MENSVTFEVSGKHWYPHPSQEGVYLPSVTAITSCYPKGEGFTRWLANSGSEEEANAIRDAAGERGTRLHAAVESLLKGERLTLDQYRIGLTDAQIVDEWKRVMAFRSWYEDHEIDVLWQEKVLYNTEYGYAGRSDLLAMVDGTPTLIDIKTSSSIYPSQFVQCEAYARCLPDTETATHLAILQLGGKNKCGFSYKSVERTESLWNDFLACKQLYHTENPNAQPVFVELPTSISL